MRTWLASLTVLALAGCGDFPRARSEAEIKELARSVAADERLQITARMDDLESRLLKAEEDARRARDLGMENAANADRFIDTFNRNVKIDNEASVRAMTARGACGQEIYYDDYNTPRSRNKACTLKDLR